LLFTSVMLGSTERERSLLLSHPCPRRCEDLSPLAVPKLIPVLYSAEQLKLGKLPPQLP